MMADRVPNRVPYPPLILALVPLASLWFYLSMTPFAGDPCYHCFVDSRRVFGMPNFADVFSNLPFLVVGLLGLRHWMREPPLLGRRSWLVFHLGVIGVAFGSGYYHWDPDDASLVWDRVPMTLAFIGLSLAMLSELVHPSFDRYLLVPALVLGAGSVFYWYGKEDLRPYLWVQTLPILIVPTTLVVFKLRYSHRRYLLYAVFFYLAAKYCESHDREVFEFFGFNLSGHTLKHLFAATGCGMIVLMLQRRHMVNPPSTPR